MYFLIKDSKFHAEMQLMSVHGGQSDKQTDKSETPSEFYYYETCDENYQ